jgi:hypothetical protein
VWLPTQEARHPRRQGDGLERLPGAYDQRVVPLDQELVQRAALEVAREEARESRRRQEHLLEKQRLTVRHPEALEVHHLGPHRDLERLGHARIRGDRLRRHDAGRRVVTKELDLLRERHRSGEIQVDRGPRGKGPSSPGSLEPAFPRQVAEGPSNGDNAAAVAGGERAGGMRSPGRHSSASSAPRRSR